MMNAETMNMYTVIAECRIAKERAEEEARHAKRLIEINSATKAWIENELMTKMAERASNGHYSYTFQLAKADSDDNRAQMSLDGFTYANGTSSYKVWGAGQKLNPNLIIETLLNLGYHITSTSHFYKSYGAGEQSGLKILISWDNRG